MRLSVLFQLISLKYSELSWEQNVNRLCNWMDIFHLFTILTYFSYGSWRKRFPRYFSSAARCKSETVSASSVTQNFNKNNSLPLTCSDNLQTTGWYRSWCLSQQVLQ
jgi:hypothetical protein